MSLRNINTALAAVSVLFILFLGASFILPLGTTFPGLPDWPTGDGFNAVKGARELATGLAIGALLVTGQRRALGWVLLLVALAPAIDMINVLAHHGSVAAALGIHGLTAAFMVVAGALVLRRPTHEHRAARRPRRTCPRPRR